MSATSEQKSGSLQPESTSADPGQSSAPIGQARTEASESDSASSNPGPREVETEWLVTAFDMAVENPQNVGGIDSPQAKEIFEAIVLASTHADCVGKLRQCLDAEHTGRSSEEEIAELYKEELSAFETLYAAWQKLPQWVLDGQADRDRERNKRRIEFAEKWKYQLEKKDRISDWMSMVPGESEAESKWHV